MPQPTPEKAAQVREAVIEAFRAQFGDAWPLNLNRNLKPSPLQEIAQIHGVSLSFVRKVRANLMMVGLMLATATDPPPADPLA